MPENHRDFTVPTNASESHCGRYWVSFFIRGVKPDGTRWESKHRHALKKYAEDEITEWGLEMGPMKIMVEQKRKKDE